MVNGIHIKSNINYMTDRSRTPIIGICEGFMTVRVKTKETIRTSLSQRGANISFVYQAHKKVHKCTRGWNITNTLPTYDRNITNASPDIVTENTCRKSPDQSSPSCINSVLAARAHFWNPFSLCAPAGWLALHGQSN